uniref:PDZ domain-containing protein n=1 Tax=Panagrellus redivivus TaxID=6233 RepID=A0A7E4V822_PANRE
MSDGRQKGSPTDGNAGTPESQLQKSQQLMYNTIEKLASLQEIQEIAVPIVVPPESDSLEITLSTNMTISSIKNTSCVLYSLIIGDQILNIAGTAPTSISHAFDLIKQHKPKFNILVGRPANREPINYPRAAGIQLKRLQGYAYFVVNLKRIDKVPLGLGIRSFRNKVTVNRVDDNGLAATAYLYGDSILDVNCERVTDTATLQRRMIESLMKFGCCNTVVERPESVIAIQNNRVVANFLSMTATTDPPMPGDCIGIAQREISRIRASANRDKPKSIYRHVEVKQKGDDSADQSTGHDTAQENSSNVHDSKDANEKHPEKHPEKHAEKKEKSFFEKSFRRKRSSNRKIAFNLKPNEVPIMSDVENGVFLQKIRSNNKTPGALTFMPKFIRETFSSRPDNNSHSPSSSSAQSPSS